MPCARIAAPFQGRCPLPPRRNQLLERDRWEAVLPGFQRLQADDVGPGLGQPINRGVEASQHSVDVERCDPQAGLARGAAGRFEAQCDRLAVWSDDHHRVAQRMFVNA